MLLILVKIYRCMLCNKGSRFQQDFFLEIVSEITNSIIQKLTVFYLVKYICEWRIAGNPRNRCFVIDGTKFGLQYKVWDFLGQEISSYLFNLFYRICKQEKMMVLTLNGDIHFLSQFILWKYYYNQIVPFIMCKCGVLAVKYYVDIF